MDPRFKDSSTIRDYGGPERIKTFSGKDTLNISSSLDDGQLQEMIFCEKSDQIIRILSYFKRHKEKLNSDLMVQLFETILFQVGKLKKQLKESPYTAEAIGEVLTEILDHFESYPDHFIYCKLIHITLRLRDYCQQVVPSHVHSFPDLRKKLNSLLSQPSLSDVKKQWFLALYACSFKQVSAVSPIEEQQELVKALY